MTGLSVVLMIAGALLLVAEAHVVSYGVLGVAGILRTRRLVRQRISRRRRNLDRA